jgi:uncharacterized membrane protein YheB (UPF0754 family)
MNLTYHLQEVIDAKMRAIDFSSTATLQELFDAEINTPEKQEGEFLVALVNYTANKSKLILLRKFLTKDNAETVLNLITENNYQNYSEQDLHHLFNYYVLNHVAVA